MLTITYRFLCCFFLIGIHFVSDLFIINFIVTEEGSSSINACKMNFEATRAALLIRRKNIPLHKQKCGELQRNQEKPIFRFSDAQFHFRDFVSPPIFPRCTRDSWCANIHADVLHSIIHARLEYFQPFTDNPPAIKDILRKKTLSFCLVWTLWVWPVSACGRGLCRFVGGARTFLSAH